MKCAFVVAVAAVTALISEPAIAYTVKGAVPCSEVMVEHYIEGHRDMNRSWLLGYFTARNLHEDADVGRGVDDELIYDRAYRYCAANLDKSWDDAAHTVYDNML